MTRLILIRHGQAMAHLEQRVMSHNCEGLSPYGRDQAAALRDRLCRTGELCSATALYASLMRRAHETAEIIAPGIGAGSLELRTDCGFCEQHHGEGDGLTWEEYEARFGTFEDWDDRLRRRAPGSETLDEVIGRVGKTLGGVIDAHAGETVVVVCHGGVVASVMEALCGVRYAQVTRFVDNTAMTEFEQDGHGKWWLVRFNDAAHLAEVPADA